MYYAGTYPESATPGASFVRNTLPPLLEAAGLTFVEEVEHSTGQWARIYRFPDGRYVLFASAWLVNAVYVLIFETYTPNGAASTVSGLGVSSSSILTTNLMADGRKAATADGSTVHTLALSSAISTSGITISIADLGGQFWFSGNGERIVVAVRSGSTDSAIYVGSITSTPPSVQGGANHFMIRMSTSNGSTTTREAGITAPKSVRGALQVTTNADGALSSVPDTFSGKYPVSRVRVQSLRDGSGRRGLLRDTFITNLTTPVNGDTAIIDGRLHVCMRDASYGYFVDTTV